MKSIAWILILPLCGCAWGCAPVWGEQRHREIQTYTLDPGVVYEIPIGTTTVTTFMFPGAITSIFAKNVSDKPGIAAFSLQTIEGSNCFSVTSNQPQAATNLNVIFRKKTYVIKLVTNDDKPLKSIYFQLSERGTAPNTGGVSNINVTSILACLDKAKAYPILKQAQPEIIDQVDFVKSNRMMYYRDFIVLIDEVYRFDAEDTIVFRIIFKNLSDHPIYYAPQGFWVRVGDRLFPQSISDANGVIPPAFPTPEGAEKMKSGKQIDLNDIQGNAGPPSIAYVAITGTPDGKRLNLQADNPWNIIVTRADEKTKIETKPE